MSLPVRGAWIEIKSDKRELIEALSSLPVRGAWIEILVGVNSAPLAVPSLPVRGAWIEMGERLSTEILHGVAPRAGSVD